MKDIQIQNIRIQRGKKLIYDAFSVNFEKGCITTVLAPSGAGNTTVLDCLAGLIVPEIGCVEGVSHPSYLFQEPRLLPWYSLEKNVLLPMKKFYSQEEAQKRVAFFLSQVELEHKKGALPLHCSGGERQRCALARAFAFPSEVLLMDEPFQSQDISLKLRLMELTERLLEKERKTVVFVTHDVREALALGDRVLLLLGTPLKIVYEVPKEILEEGKKLPVRQRYTCPNSRVFETEKLLLTYLSEHSL